ncbi:MAG: hypothetical protein IT393_11845 [Nitrospirae bacterium]|nr:hypothetical protein [Nitrospirota bacterium]
MSKILIRIILSVFLTMLMVDSLFALTFEFNKEKPGVREFVSKNLRFTAGGENIIPKLPSSFYMITYFPDDIPVIAYKGSSPFLDRISGGKSAKTIKGPHGEKILYNPGRPPEKKLLSSYALWDGWVLIGNKKETLQNVLKLYKSPSDISKTGMLTPNFSEWKEGGVRFWGDNSDGHMTKIFEAQKKSLLIPLVKDPGKIQAITGAFKLTTTREMRGKIMVKPVNPQAVKDIEGDARFISETVRRRLTAVKSQYEGRINSSNGNIIYDVYIGDYEAARGEIMKNQ